MLRDYEAVAGAGEERPVSVPFLLASPRPGIAKPKCGQKVKGFTSRSTVDNRDANKDIVGCGLGVFGKYIEIPVLIENTGIQQFEFRILLAASTVFFNQACVWEGVLRILVKRLQVGMRRRRVHVEVALLDVLAMIAFAVGQPKQ